MLHTEVAQRLDAQIGTLIYRPDAGGGNVFIGHMPDKPNTAVAVMAPGGPSPEDEHLGYDMVRVQLIVRGSTDPTLGWELAEICRRDLAGLLATALPGGTLVLRTVGSDSAPVAIGTDEAGRYEYTVNLTFEVAQVTDLRPLT